MLRFFKQATSNIKFSLEHEENNKLAFLDTWVCRGIDKYRTTIHHRKTFTGVYLNWKSLTARKYKLGLIKCLMNRIWQICSDETSREQEIVELKKNLEQNDYPQEIVLKEIERFRIKQNRQNQEKSLGPDKLKKFIVLPYVHRDCEKFAIKLEHLVNGNLPQVEFNVAYQTPKTIGSYFPFKDNIKKPEDRSLVVYKISCKDYAKYIGKTERILSHRIKEHQKSESSACLRHSKETKHTIDYDNIEIIDKADSDLKLRIKELLHIQKQKPTLNKKLNSQSDFDIKTLIIQAYPQFRTQTVSN
jgi:predicted GIY-YIG superfamily endonuclease